MVLERNTKFQMCNAIYIPLISICGAKQDYNIRTMGADERALNSMSKGHCSSWFYHLIQYNLGKHNFPAPQFLIYTTD